MGYGRGCGDRRRSARPGDLHADRGLWPRVPCVCGQAEAAIRGKLTPCAAATSSNGLFSRRRIVTWPNEWTHGPHSASVESCTRPTGALTRKTATPSTQPAANGCATSVAPDGPGTRCRLMLKHLLQSSTFVLWR